jgi:Cell division protein FtsI/penicillin-binding protein 2
MAKQKKPPGIKLRFFIINALCIVSLVIGFVLLLLIQIVHGSENLEKSALYTEISYVVPAVRGEIYDRYGEVFVTNNAVLNLVIRKPFINDKGENELLRNLVALFAKENAEYAEDIPITKTAPFEFVPDREADIEKLKKLLRLGSYATAEDVLSHLKTTFDINTGDAQLDRDIACLRGDMFAISYGRYQPYTFAIDVTTNIIAITKEQSDIFAGVMVEESAQRFYENNTVASHIIGDIGAMDEAEYKVNKEKGYSLADLVGKSGVEKAFEDQLRGTQGRRTITQNVKNEVVKIEDSVPSKPGNNVSLTLDKRFQEEVQVIVADYVNWCKTQKSGNNIKGGSVSILDPNTGEVLALVNYPTYDINEYKKNYKEVSETEGNPLFNRALLGLYRPGSTFKTVIAAAALNYDDPEGAIINKSSTVNCGHVYRFYAPGYQPLCLGTHGNTNVVNSIRISCNIFFYDVGRRCGIDRIERYAQNFGLGVSNGFELPTETGHVSSPKVKEDWVAGDVIQTAIGQSENSFTPLQLSVQAMVLANKGTRYKTSIIKEINSYDKKEQPVLFAPQVLSKIESPESTFDIINEGMVAAAAFGQSYGNVGTAGTVAFKSGTPQISNTRFNSATVAYYPAAAPEIAIGIMMEEGDYSRYLIRPIAAAWDRVKAARAAEQEAQNVS